MRAGDGDFRGVQPLLLCPIQLPDPRHHHVCLGHWREPGHLLCYRLPTAPHGDGQAHAVDEAGRGRLRRVEPPWASNQTMPRPSGPAPAIAPMAAVLQFPESTNGNPPSAMVWRTWPETRACSSKAVATSAVGSISCRTLVTLGLRPSGRTASPRPL